MVKVISLPCLFQVLYVLCFTKPRYQGSVYIGPLVLSLKQNKKVSIVGQYLFSVPVSFESTELLKDL